MGEKRRIIMGHNQEIIMEEILEEILYNLPIKSLLRFKCVSKSWHSIISGEAFIKEHLKRSIAKDETAGLTGLTHHKLLFTYRYKYSDQTHDWLSSCLGSCSLNCNQLLPAAIEPTLYDRPDPYVGGVTISGSCNGLILIRFGRISRLILWNPSTTKYRVIPYPSFEQLPLSNYYRSSFGLWYNDESGEYKVVCIRDDGWCYQTKVYGSKTDSWTTIESFGRRLQEGSYCGKFVNGRLHWLARLDYSSTRRCRCDIISLDLAADDEKYKYETLSTNCIDYSRGAVFLRDLGGYLGLMHLTDDADVNVWVMKEYGVRESWTRVWTLSDFVVDIVERGLGGGTKPLCWRKNGDILVVFGKYLFVCNGKNLLRKSRVGKLDDRVFSIVYVESLLSPSMIGHQQ
ncbi:PREDICTED: F-box/kelch-repeat protein At3g23880-like [Erythranthe guttata]|nr:PREDICTED: F-box/kelch-repeat protein At3g23880-like [Erythranthe guttata]|eukprot:XP_012842227.1 PREDICTED: F-box/kelch-repeat protein At3g23880-like [Erythranthe guttata]